MQDLNNVVGPAEFDSPDSLDARNELQEELGTHPLPWFEWLRLEIELAAGERVLELGSGAGDLWEDGFGQEAHLVLSDYSPGMLAAIRQYNPVATLLAADAQAIPLADASAGAVIAVGVLDLLPDLPEALAEVSRVLQPGGRFYATAGGRYHLDQLEELVRPFWPEVSLGGDPDQFGVENGAAILEQFFPRVERKAYRDELVFEQVEPVLEYVMSEEVIRQQLAGEQLPRFVAYASRYLKRKGELRVRRVKALFTAWKGR